jgi:4-amino-4-deoxy-L-arabinose transferase-like glycosyltransferase
VLFHTGRLPTDFFASSAYAFMHPDYPLLVPVFESIEYRAIGAVDTRAIHLQFWLLLIAFVLAVLYLGFRRGTLLEWLPLAVVVAITPSVVSQIFTAYADIPMALFLSLGALLLGEWLTDRNVRKLALATLFLAGSASTKNEGLMAAIIVLVVAGAMTVIGKRRPDLRQLFFAAAAFAAAILPWRIWLSVEGIHGDISIRKGLEPSYLADRTDRIWPSVESLYGQVTQGGWLYAVPIAMSIALVCLLIRGRRSIAAFYLASGVLAFAALVWVYWISPTTPLSGFLSSSAYRVGAVLAALAFAALLQLPVPARDD